MIRFVLTALFGVFLLTQPVAANAAVDAAGAAHLKDVFTKYLDARKSSMKASNQDLQTEGPLTVEPAGTYYAITLPHLSLHRPDGSYTDIGIFAVNALPGVKPNEWKITLASPTPITGYDATKAPELRITLGKQSFDGIWNEDIQNFSKLDAQYLDVLVEQIKDGMTIKIPKTTIVYNLIQDSGAQTWSGPARYEMSNIEAVQKGDPGISKIGSIAMDMMVRNYDPTKATAYQQKMSQLSASTQKFTSANMSPEQIKDFYGTFFDYMSSAWSGFDSKMTFSNISLARANGNFNLKQAVFGFDMNGFKTGSVTLHLNLGYDGLSIVPPPDGFNDAVPTHLNLDVTGDKIPLKELTDLGMKNMHAAGGTPDAKRAAGMEMAKLVPQLLTQAGTTIKVTQSSFSNTTYNVFMDGLMNANVKAVMGATGKLRLEIAGSDQLIKVIQQQLKDPKLTDLGRANLQKTMATVTVLQAIGQQAKNAQGQPVRGYDIELTDQGKILLNGADMSMLQAMTGAVKQKEAPMTAAPAPATPKH